MKCCRRFYVVLNALETLISHNTVIVYMYDLCVILLKYYEMHIKLILIKFREEKNTGLTINNSHAT